MKIVKTEATRKQNRVKSTPPKEGSKKLFLFISVRLPAKEVLLKSLWKKSRGKIKSLTTKQAAAKMWQKRARKWKFRPNSVRTKKIHQSLAKKLYSLLQKQPDKPVEALKNRCLTRWNCVSKIFFFFFFFFGGTDIVVCHRPGESKTAQG